MKTLLFQLSVIGVDYSDIFIAPNKLLFCDDIDLARIPQNLIEHMRDAGLRPHLYQSARAQSSFRFILPGELLFPWQDREKFLELADHAPILLSQGVQKNHAPAAELIADNERDWCVLFVEPTAAPDPTAPYFDPYI